MPIHFPPCPQQVTCPGVFDTDTAIPRSVGALERTMQYHAVLLSLESTMLCTVHSGFVPWLQEPPFRCDESVLYQSICNSEEELCQNLTHIGTEHRTQLGWNLLQV